jgi:hypothetical protein
MPTVKRSIGRRALRRAAAAVCAALAATAGAQDATGPEFQVHTYTTNGQQQPAVASDGSGNFVVAWQSYVQDGSSHAVIGRRFDAAGAPQGPEFQVNVTTLDSQYDPALALRADGSFVVVWSSYGQDAPGGRGIVGRRFDAAGVAVGGEFPVNAYTTSDQRFPNVAMDASGNFVVVWSSSDQDGGGQGVFAQRFNAAGTPQGGEFRVNAFTTGNQFNAAAAAHPSGSFVVVWRSLGQDGSVYGIFGQRYDATGTPQGGEFPVNSYTTNNQRDPRVAMDADGNFVVAWQSINQGGTGYGYDVYAQRYDAFGAPAGGEFRVNSYTTGYQGRIDVASDAEGNFVVVWHSSDQDGDQLGVFGQHYDAAGTPQGGEFRVNTYTTEIQRSPAVAAVADGDFVVAWHSRYQDGDGYGVFAQRFGDLIFKDGVESAGLSRWSSAVTDGADLAVTGPAALAGTGAGLQAFVDDTNPLFVRDDSPEAEDSYRARFYFDPNGFDPGESANHRRVRLLIAFNAANQRLATIVLRRLAGTYAVMGRARLDDGTRSDTGFFTVTDAPHFVELRWRRATAPGANDGSFLLRIDDVLVSSLGGIDNDLSSVDYARMGAMSIKSAAAGTLFFDEFESRRQRRIGPE